MFGPLTAELVKQAVSKPDTNLFPAPYAPPSVTEFLEKVERGEAKLVPPVKTPDKFRGKILYDRDKCIGCQLCIKVCSPGAIEFIKEEKKIKIYVSRCIFCSQCNDICPVKCLHMSEDFLIADYDPYTPNLVVR